MSDSPGQKDANELFSPSGKRVTVVGLGSFGGGVGAVRWLCKHGADVTVSDSADENKLSESIKSLEGLPVKFHLGGHLRDDFLNADLLIVNPAVPANIPLLVEAIERNIPFTTEINLFIERCPATIVGITGSVGKSTVSAMTADILKKKFTVHLGGNIGRSLLENLNRIKPSDVIVLEMSSFQLENLPIISISPHVAMVTNLFENHLDRHGSMEEYASAKMNIFRYQQPGDVLILNADCPRTKLWASQASGKVEFFRHDDEPFALAVPGKHNQSNAMAAWSAARTLGVSRTDSADALRKFTGLEHRLQFVAQHDGIRYFNDSKCTTPQGAIVALDAFDPREAVIILGGYDKQVNFDELASSIVSHAAGAVVIGQTKEKITTAIDLAAKRLPKNVPAPPVKTAETLENATKIAQNLANKGNAILLSPACASYGMFDDYRQRGKKFIEIVNKF